MINPLLYFLLFLKASLFSTGGFSNLPSLHQDLLGLGWAKESNFANSVAIGQVSPGPNGLWVISLGYLTDGVRGAVLALIAITLPPLLVLLVAHLHARFAHLPWVDGLMRGISLAVVSIFIFVCWTIIHQPGLDWTSWVIAVVALLVSLRRRVPVLVLLALAGVTGLLLYR